MGICLPAVVLAVSVAAASAADIPKGKTSDPQQACRWVSDCQACTRSSDGKLICSNIGIACQPKKSRCEPLVR
jgi:hypothetical protein